MSGSQNCESMTVFMFAVFIFWLDDNEGSSSDTAPLFQMAGDGKDTDDIKIPMLFLFSKEGSIILDAIREYEQVEVLLSDKAKDRGKGKATCVLRQVSINCTSSITKVSYQKLIFGSLVKISKIFEDGFKIKFSFENKSSETFIWLCLPSEDVFRIIFYYVIYNFCCNSAQ